MERLRLPFLIIALALMLAVVGAELAAPLLFGLSASPGQSPPGVAIRTMVLIDLQLLFITVLCALPLLLPERVHARIQGLATLIVAILVVLAAIAVVFLTLALLAAMVGLLLAVPFGTIAYLALFGHFATGAAAAILASLFLAKVAYAVCLLLAHQRFLENKGLVLLTLTALLGGIIVSFLHGLVPGFLVSITDAIAGIVLAIVAIIWAIILAIGSLPAIVKAISLRA